MITYSKLGFKGNLGNQMFQIASTIGIAEKNDNDFFFIDWQYSKYFSYKFPVSFIDESFIYVKEKKFNYYERNLNSGNYDLDGWLQSEKYFNVKKTKEIFKFEKEFEDKLINKYRFLFLKKTILISVRRGDFVNNPYYFQLSFKYYFFAITENFPDWQDRNLIFASDDIKYCKYHFSFLKNAFFLENLDAIEQMLIGSKCDDFVISNSTFSWWIAWLGEKTTTKIIRPVKNFRGQFGMQNDDSDYFPSRWISFSDTSFKLKSKYFILKIRGYIYSFYINVRYEYLNLKKASKNLIKNGLVFFHFR